MAKAKLTELIADAASLQRQIKAAEDLLAPLIDDIKGRMAADGLAAEEGTDGSVASLVPTERVEWLLDKLTKVLTREQVGRFCPPTPAKALLTSFFESSGPELQAALRTCRKVTTGNTLRIRQPEQKA